LKNLRNSLKLSAENFGSIPAIAVCGMLLALKIVLGYFTVPVGNLLKIGFSFLPIAVSGMLFGPAISAVLGAVGDIVSYVVQPSGPFFPGFTLNAMISGFLYGAILYRKPVSFLRVLAAKTSVTVIISLMLNPLWLSILYGKAFIVVFAARIATNLILLPIETTMLYTLLKIMEKRSLFDMKKTS